MRQFGPPYEKGHDLKQIAWNRLLDPNANAAYAIVGVALSLFVFAYSIRFGPILILLFYGLWLPIFLVHPSCILSNFQRVIPLLLLPALAAVSTLWSDVAGATLRASIQYGTTVFCGLVAARLVSMPNLAAGGVVGSLAILTYSVFNGGYSYDVVDGSYAFDGAFGSKNQLGYFCSLAVLFSLAVFALYRSEPVWRILAAVTGALALVLLVMSESATSILSLGFALGILGLGLGLAVLPTYLRTASITLVLFTGIGLGLSAYYLGAFDATLAAFGKDTTLTGRTYLWQTGITQGSENPVLGLGYYAFWIPGRSAAEDLWEQFYITGRTGFHFHNTLIEAYVGLGLIGVGVVGSLMLALVIQALIVVHRGVAITSSALAAALALLFVVRSAVEIDFLTPYTAGSFLMPFLLLKMADGFSQTTKRGRGYARGDHQMPVGRPLLSRSGSVVP